MSVDDPRLLDPGAGLALWNASADALEAWDAAGRVGPRPAGWARRHRPEPVSALARWWAAPIYRLVVDPDGRPRRLRGTTRF